MARTPIRQIKVIKLVRREDGEIVEMQDPRPCQFCGRTCTAKVVLMSDGREFGADCAEVVDMLTNQARFMDRPLTEDDAFFLSATRRQIKTLRAEGWIE